MAELWRWLDTGLAAPAQHVALNRALLECRAAAEIPTTLRFARVTRSIHLGVQQSAAQMLDLDYCRTHEIAIQRQITGGHATYTDERQIIFELYLGRRDIGEADLRAVSRRVCHAAATAIKALRIDAQYRFPNEIEVDGRLLGSSSCAVEKDAVLFQATLFVDLEPIEALRCLRIASGDEGAEAAARIVSLTRLLGRKPDVRLIKHYIAEALESDFDVEFREADLELTENARYETALRQIDTPDWTDLVARPASDMPLLHAHLELSDTTLGVHILYDRPTRTIRDIWLTGPAAVPLRPVIGSLEAALRGVAVADLERRLDRFFGSRPPQPGALSATAISATISHALRNSLPARS